MRQGGFCKVFDDPGCLWSLRCNRKSGMEAAYAGCRSHRSGPKRPSGCLVWP